jgi:microcin C transport system permease protein
MKNYFLKRLFFIPFTLFFILLLNFTIVQFAPGGPVEQMLATLKGHSSNLSNLGSTTEGLENKQESDFNNINSIDSEIMEQLNKTYGFEKPFWDRFLEMVSNYIFFDFGDSFFSNSSVLELIVEKLPVSISLGLFSTLIVYLISIPLGILKAVKNGTNFDIYSSFVILIGNAVPVFLFGIILIMFFASGEFFNLFPLRGLTSDNFDEMGFFEQILDYLWHLTLPILALVIGSFATLTMLTKNSFLDEINKQYVVTARSKGIKERDILLKHVFPNGMLIIIAGFPSAFVNIFFTSSVLIEIIFSLDGLGLLGYESLLNRDYPVIFGTLYIFTLIALIVNLISDLIYSFIDPRINFNKI